MKTTRFGFTAALGFLLLVQIGSAATLIHRYTFTTNANDVVGNAHGVVMGGAVFDGAGGLVFDGNNDYVRLPPGIISSLDEVSMEAWVTWQRGTAPYWQRIFDFGSRGAMDRGESYFFLTTAAEQNWIRATIAPSAFVENPQLDSYSPMPTNVETYVAVTYSPSLGLAKLYLNGVAVDAGAAIVPLNLITDTNNWLGVSQFIWDPPFKGRFSEFRIYRGFLLDSDVAASFLAGPDNPGAAEGTLICTALAGDVSTNAAVLNALVKPNGLATAVFFEFGRTTNYGMSTAVLDAGSGNDLASVGALVTNLTAGTIYHFRCVATNAAGTNYGGDTGFITLPLITSFVLNTNGHAEIRFEARTGSSYFLQQATNLPPDRWRGLTNSYNSPITADGPFGFTDLTATNFPVRFYRLMVRDF